MLILLLYLVISEASFGIPLSTKSTFRQSAIEAVTLDNIEYYFYNYRVSWEEARIICLGDKSELAILNTDEKALFIAHETSESSLALDEYWIGSKMNFKGTWIWINNNEKLELNPYFQRLTMTLKYGNRSLENYVYCLTLFRKKHNVPMFVPLQCQQLRPFICQKEISVGNVEITELFSMNVEKKSFVLYSATLTWFEAVMECRKRGKQIAEVSTLHQAQNLAIGMLKVRPRSVENMWIAGYMKNREWIWLTTGSRIIHNEMWQYTDAVGGNCLLLDRHIYKQPTYLNAKCELKRNFLCQIPEIKRNSEELVSVIIDTCHYWIGMSPLTWFEANQSCKQQNATLVVLDSPTTIEQVIRIMIDNNEPLQHIWIDGKKTFKHENSNQQNDTKIWKWKSTGNEIDNNKDSYIPWCEDCHCYEDDSDCLNMDRVDFDVPYVYGLNCEKKQKYICQYRSVTCENSKKSRSKDLLHSKHKRIRNSTSSVVKLCNKVSSNSKYLNISTTTEKKVNEVTTMFSSSESTSVKAIQKTSDYETSKSNDQNYNLFEKFLNRQFNSINGIDSANVTGKNSSLTELDERKHQNSSENQQKSILGFKDIIELMVKNMGEQGSEESLLSRDKLLEKSKVEDEKRKSNGTGEKYIKENVSKIIQTSIEKSRQSSDSNNSRSAALSGLSRLLNVEQLKMISDLGESPEKPRVNRVSESQFSPFNNKTEKINPVDDNNSIDRVKVQKKTTIPNRTIQSFVKKKREHKEIVDFNDVVNNFDIRMHRLNLTNRLLSEFSKARKLNDDLKFIKSWNLLLEHILESLNSTVSNVNREIMKIYEKLSHQKGEN